MRDYAGPPQVEHAPAKINLALHVTGQRGDGYHLLDSLVVFTRLGDRLHLSAGDGVTLSGPFAGGLSATGNLCAKAAHLAGARLAVGLEKNLPVASGIGGGSSDAAAVLRGLQRAGWVLPDMAEITRLGADIPACLVARPLRMQGIGDHLTPVAGLPVLNMVLVNPGVTLSTPAVFAALENRDNPNLPEIPARFADQAELLGWLAQCRNDLQAPALSLAPPIGAALAALRAENAAMARMSGSGATCFGLFLNAAAAAQAAGRIRAAQPGWWVQATQAGDADVMGLAHGCGAG